jgi:dolichyl-phosphate beta-glucosyltransferase
MSVGFVIPTYNYRQGIAKSFAQLKAWRQDNAVECTVYFVDDGSTDGTRQVLQSLTEDHGDWCVILSHSLNRGKGAAVRTGFEAAKHQHDFVIMTDCDLHYGLDIIAERLLPELADNDIVILDRSWTQEAQPVTLLRKIASGAFNRLVAIFTGVTIRDTQAGLKGFRVRPCAPLFSALTLNGFSWDVEMLSLAQFYRLRVIQLPVIFDDRHMLPKHSTINILRTPWIMLYDLLRINLNWKRGRYKHVSLMQRVTKNVYRIPSGTKTPPGPVSKPDPVRPIVTPIS